MDNTQPTTSDKKSSCITKICPIILIILTGTIIWCLGFLLGKNTSCNTPVLGVQSDTSISSKLLAFLGFNFEQPSVNINQLQLRPDVRVEPLFEPSPEEAIDEIVVTPEPSSSEQPSMIYGGTNRTKSTPKPSATPSDYNPAETEAIEGDHRKQKATPDPTPKYKYDPSRSRPSPTPIVNPVATERIQQILDSSGIKLEKPSITKTNEQNQITISGSIKDKIFGFLPIDFPIAIIVDENNGEVLQMQLPWWRTLFGKFTFSGVSQVRCGDGICNSSENPTTCPTDCVGAVCGNNICEYGEGINNCSADCVNVGIPQK